LARMKNCLHGVRQLVDVEDTDALELRHAVQVEVVGQYRRGVLARIRHQLGVHLADLRVGLLADLVGGVAFLLGGGRHSRPPTPPSCDSGTPSKRPITRPTRIATTPSAYSPAPASASWAIAQRVGITVMYGIAR